MQRTLLALSAAALLAACGATEEPTREAKAPAADAPAAAATTDAQAAGTGTAAGLDAALAGEWRSAENRARDAWRHPRETLAFFGVEPTHTVVEITPGGGWYTEILAPWLRDQGRYVAAVVDPERAPNERAREYYANSLSELEAKIGDRTVYGEPTLALYDPRAPRFGEAGSADVVLTFRNVHNWRGSGDAQAMFNGFFEVLRPGGTLGVVEHRAAQDVPDDDRTGYVSEAQVIALAEAAGFQLAGRSEINANPADTKDHPNGVWTLPPTLNVPEGADRAAFEAIGESDRMTLRFTKPQG